MTAAALIGIDWGSSSVRALRIAADGAILEVRRGDDGVFTGTGPFDTRLDRLIAGWNDDLPILLCGMVGSDRGWLTVPYVAAPAGPRELAQNLRRVGHARPAYIVPGLSFADGAHSDVMRGEETLIAGLLARTGLANAVICLPGTHSKWAQVEDGRIARFRTYMTGELRALVLAQGALAIGVAQIASDAAFAQGLAAVADAGATAALFQARARRLLGSLAAEHTASFVTGVLIGAEIAREAPRLTTGAAPLVLAARDAPAHDYAAALGAAGRSHETIDPEPLAAQGLLSLAAAAGLLA